MSGCATCSNGLGCLTCFNGSAYSNNTNCYSCSAQLNCAPNSCNQFGGCTACSAGLSVVTGNNTFGNLSFCIGSGPSSSGLRMGASLVAVLGAMIALFMWGKEWI